jgi:hypothetical protein
MSRFAARSVRATLLLSLGVVLVVTPGGGPALAGASGQDGARRGTAVSGSPLAGSPLAGAHLSGPPHGKDGKLR